MNFWTISGHIGQLPVMGGDVRYMLKSLRDFRCLTFYLCTDLNASLGLKLLAFWCTRSKSGHKKGGLTPLPVMMVPATGQHVVTGL